MKLTAKQIFERSIITGRLGQSNIAQVGIDLNVIEIKNISSGGFIPKEGKTVLPRTTTIELFHDNDGHDFWQLSPGIYEIVLEQGCDIPADCSMDLYPRSSLARIGGGIVTPKWDPGFRTERMTSFMILYKTVRIEKGARLVQACVFQNDPVDELYNGQFQGR